MYKEILNQVLKNRVILSVKFTPTKIEKLFGYKESIRKFIDSGKVRTFRYLDGDPNIIWLEYPSYKSYDTNGVGTCPEFDEYYKIHIRPIKASK